MNRKYLAFDMETAKILPDGVDNLKRASSSTFRLAYGSRCHEVAGTPIRHGLAHRPGRVRDSPDG